MTEAIAVPTSLPPNQECRSVLALETNGMARGVPDSVAIMALGCTTEWR